MLNVREHLLAIRDHPMGSVAESHALHSLRPDRRPMARQTLRQPNQARAVTISLMLSAPARVEQAGHPNNHRKVRKTKNHPEEA